MKVTIVIENPQKALDWSTGRVTLSDAGGIYFDSGEQHHDRYGEENIAYDYPLPTVRKDSILTVGIFSLQKSAPASVYLNGKKIYEFTEQSVGWQEMQSEIEPSRPNLFDLLPMLPWEGPPLPRFLGILWPRR